MTALARFVLMALLGAWLSPATAAAAERELLVSAAISLKEVMTELAAAFEAAHPDLTVALNFAASGQLRGQIENGAPVDVFVPASADDLDRLERAALVLAGTRADVARNRLVLVRGTASGTPALGALADVARPDVKRVAIGNPATVPGGRYAREALETAGLWTTLQRKLILAENVRQVLDYVARGEVDAGLVFRTDARTEARVQVVLELPAASHALIVYPAAVLAASARSDDARSFVAFLHSPAGRAVFEKHGFDVAPAVP